MITPEYIAFNNQDIAENAITSENVTPNSQEEFINDEHSYLLSADDVVTTQEKLIEFNEKFPLNDLTTSYINEWIDSCIIAHGSTIQELREALAKNGRIAETNYFLENQQQQLIAANRNRKLQNEHALFVLRYAQFLEESQIQQPTAIKKKGEKLEPPIAVKKVSFNFNS